MTDLSLALILRTVDRATGPLRQVTAAVQQATGRMRDAFRQLQQGSEITRDLNFAAQALGEFSRKAQGLVRGPLDAAIAFESAMADVRKVVDFPTPAAFGEMRDELLRLSTQIPLTAAELAQITAFAGQAGLPREEILRFTADAARMGVAFDIAAAEAGGAMTGLRSIFALNQDQVVRLGDAFNHLSNNMDARAADLLEVANRAGATARLFGLTGQQAGALGATFLALKTPPQVAATGMNAMLSMLQTASTQSKEFQGVLRALGMSARELEQDIAQDAGGALLAFLGRIEQLAPEKRAKALALLFGREYADDLAKLVGGMDIYRKALGLVGDETAFAGSMTREYEARAQTTANNLILLNNQLAKMRVTLGDALLPALNGLLAWLRPIIEGISAWAKAHPGLTKGLMLAVAGVAALTAVFSVLLSILATGAGVLLVLKVGFGGLGGVAGLVKGVFVGLGASVLKLVTGLGTLAASAAPAALASLQALLPIAAKLGLLGAAGAAGYGLGTLLNAGIDKVLSAAAGRETSLGTAIYDLLHREPAATLAPGSAGQSGRTDVGGTIGIRIDQDGRARVTEVSARNRAVDFEVDYGLAMVGP